MCYYTHHSQYLIWLILTNRFIPFFHYSEFIKISNFFLFLILDTRCLLLDWNLTTSVCRMIVPHHTSWILAHIWCHKLILYVHTEWKLLYCKTAFYCANVTLSCIKQKENHIFIGLKKLTRPFGSSSYVFSFRVLPSLAIFKWCVWTTGH